ncbi:hypothetical protein ABH920_004365 [Catenulispora sp. EB89]
MGVILALIVFVLWLIGFGIRGGAAAGSGGRRRWYGRW